MKMEIVYRGNGFLIEEENGKYQMSWLTGIAGREVSYPVSLENIEKAKKSSRDAYEVMIYVSTGHWPPTEEEKLESTRNFLRKFPDLLLKIPENQKFFNEQELEELLQKAEEGRLKQEGKTEK